MTYFTNFLSEILIIPFCSSDGQHPPMFPMLNPCFWPVALLEGGEASKASAQQEEGR